MTTSNAEVFADLYSAHHSRIYAYCARRSRGDSVEDLVAEVYLTVWRKISDAPPGEDVLKWMYRIAYLVLRNHWRGSSRHQKLQEKLESIGVQPVPLIADQVVVRDELRELLSAAQKLRERDIEILRLAHWEHLTTVEIATVLDISPNAAKQRLHRARRNLGREYEKALRKKGSISHAVESGGER